MLTLSPPCLFSPLLCTPSPSGVDIPASSLPSLLEPFLASLPTAPASWADLPKALAAVRTHATLRWALPLELKAALEGLFEGRFGDQKAEKERRAKVRPCHALLCCRLTPVGPR